MEINKANKHRVNLLDMILQRIELIKALKLGNQRDLAAYCGVTEVHMSYIVSGKRTPSFRLATKLMTYKQDAIEALIDRTK